MWKLNLQQFAGALTVTVMKDADDNWTAASARASSKWIWSLTHSADRIS